MPIYEYKCQECGKRFEALRSIKDADDPIQCQACRSMKTQRIPSACFSKVAGGSASSASGGCSGCSGGSCASCGH